VSHPAENLPEKPSLVRVLGRWTLTALVVNSVIGSGVFGLPDDLVRLVGSAAPWAYVFAAGGIAVFMAVFAELGSQFREAGGWPAVVSGASRWRGLSGWCA
jgi:amino acid transporter